MLNKYTLFCCFFGNLLVAGSISMPTADIEAPKSCAMESEFKTTSGRIRGISMTTSALVVSPFCSPHRRLLLGADLEMGWFSSDSGIRQQFVGNPRARLKVNLLSWPEMGGWKKLTAEIRMPISSGASVRYFADQGVWRQFNAQLQRISTGFGPEAGLRFGIDRPKRITTLGADYAPRWSRNRVATGQEITLTANHEQNLAKLPHRQELNLMIGVSASRIGQGTVNGMSLNTTGGKMAMGQVGMQYVVHRRHIIETTYERMMWSKLGSDQIPRSNTLRVAYRFRF